MRPVLVAFVLLAATACSRSHAPATGASAKPPGPDAAIAQTVPAGGAPAPAASLAGPAPVAVDATGKDEAPADKSDKRWQDVDPNTLGGRDENALANFQAEQRRRDAELMQKDAAEAKARVAGREDEAPRADDRGYADGAYADGRYAAQPYADARGDDRRRDDPRDDGRDDESGPYGDLPPDEQGPYDDEGAYDEPPPYDEDDESYPPPDEDYDPDYDPRYQR